VSLKGVIYSSSDHLTQEGLEVVVLPRYQLDEPILLLPLFFRSFLVIEGVEFNGL